MSHYHGQYPHRKFPKPRKPSATMKRENGTGPFKIPFCGRWVLRDSEGNYIGHDQFRNDLKDRYEAEYEIEIIGD
ncbi:hypothetical protein EVB55_214 [Rhizobium phage RHph_Y68]|uniref:Uncharacterized protein n=1 Tax=Rhizobium phage RHph_Y68 TaxID=2509787 RepID=A0A7S5R9C8_9CAUD|nr:hypothetical protein PP934_gp214 [Rhizobium phage RHph_Y68]QIG68149.1 hypothetical protein EVB55_214 [Rhizobium phage RHph_Y68]